MIRRRSNESVLLGEDIEIQVLEITGNRVKLGISAPRELLVLRKELREAEEFNRAASRPVLPAHVLSLAATLLKSRPGVEKPVAPAAGGKREVVLQRI